MTSINGSSNINASERQDALQFSFGEQATLKYSLAELYADMATPEFWGEFYLQLVDEHVRTKLLYTNLANQRATLAELANDLIVDAQAEIDHTVLDFNGEVLNDTYIWDVLGNLSERNKHVVDLVETFEYDELNRRIGTQMSGKRANHISSLAVTIGHKSKAVTLQTYIRCLEEFDINKQGAISSLKEGVFAAALGKSIGAFQTQKKRLKGSVADTVDNYARSGLTLIG